MELGEELAEKGEKLGEEEGENDGGLVENHGELGLVSICEVEQSRRRKFVVCERCICTMGAVGLFEALVSIFLKPFYLSRGKSD